jgi:hypothetical protein
MVAIECTDRSGRLRFLPILPRCLQPGAKLIGANSNRGETPMLRFNTLMALLVAFVLVNGVSFQAGATTPDTILKSGQETSQAGSSQAGSSQIDSSQVDGTAWIRLTAAKLDPNATYKGSGVVCKNYCRNERQFICHVRYIHGRRTCACGSAGPCRNL